MDVEPNLNPPEPEQLGVCEECGEPLHAGQEVIELNDRTHLCDMDCFHEYVKEAFEPRKILMGE